MKLIQTLTQVVLWSVEVAHVVTRSTVITPMDSVNGQYSESSGSFLQMNLRNLLGVALHSLDNVHELRQHQLMDLAPQVSAWRCRPCC